MKLCQIYNTLPQYRVGIYKLIDKEFNTDWYYGKVQGGIKCMDVSILKGNKYELNNHFFFKNSFYWQSGVLSTLFKPYQKYIILGEERCLSTWVFCILSRFFPKKKVYFWTHGVYGREGWIKKCIEWVFNRLVDGSFIYNNYSRNIMMSRGMKPEKLYTIHNSLDYDKQLELRNAGLDSDVFRKHFGNSNPVLIMIGRLNLRKRLALLIEAVSALKQDGANFNIVLVGDGEDKNNLKNLIEDKGLSNQTWFYGACYDERTNAELIYNADLCVVPGDVGLTAIHSMMFGTPVVTHNYFPCQGPEFEAIHPDKTGDYFEQGNVESLAKVIKKWFVNHMDREVTRDECYNEIDTQWNPQFQIEVLKKVLS